MTDYAAAFQICNPFLIESLMKVDKYKEVCFWNDYYMIP